jgi:2-oxoglutarate dehydrogenase E2 component (dihydrolipoamide succinyltransferase)
MSRLRSTIAQRLLSVKQETAMLTTFNEVDLKPIKNMRAKYGKDFEAEHGVKLGFMCSTGIKKVSSGECLN